MYQWCSSIANMLHWIFHFTMRCMFHFSLCFSHLFSQSLPYSFLLCQTYIFSSFANHGVLCLFSKQEQRVTFTTSCGSWVRDMRRHIKERFYRMRNKLLLIHVRKRTRLLTLEAVWCRFTEVRDVIGWLIAQARGKLIASSNFFF